MNNEEERTKMKEAKDYLTDGMDAVVLWSGECTGCLKCRWFCCSKLLINFACQCDFTTMNFILYIRLAFSPLL